ncbi:hypothetical protein [Acinetobacter sp. P1(2025)]|uniref:hypothetical protein n=1 Tax=Acinetobacter sp. P1(2025) TaxID=3446120 RepID=UPI003F53BD4F
MKKLILKATIVLLMGTTLAQAETTTVKESTIKGVADPRVGVRADKLFKGEIQDVTSTPLQTGGGEPLFNNLFKPTLAEWLKSGRNTKLTPSDFVREGDTPTPTIKNATIEEVADLSKLQYFYRNSLHAELKGKRAEEILNFTKSTKGKVYVSTTIEKVYPLKKYTDDDTGKVEHAQCIDVLTRITVTQVPAKTPYGLSRNVDFWQDLKNYQCHSDSPES